jgi:ribosomal protein S18 acetylase RimI-like enzyme
VRLDDWRNASHDIAAGLYAREQRRWLGQLGWDASPSWAIVEQARRDGQLPGLIAFDDQDAVVGWSFFLLREGTLQIGALSSPRADVVRALIDAVLEAPEATLARRYQCFVFPESPAVEVALARRRFQIDRYLYLERPLATTSAAPMPTPEGAAAKPARWADDDLTAAVRLMARAYAGSAGARCFAPNGRLDEWGNYLGQLIRTPACGHFAADESFAARSHGQLGAFLIATRVGPATTHVAQVVVDPEMRRRGSAARLLDESAAQAAARGATRQTLLVAESNAPARALYDKLGFSTRATFVFADRSRITRQATRSVDRPASVAV